MKSFYSHEIFEKIKLWKKREQIVSHEVKSKQFNSEMKTSYKIMKTIKYVNNN